MEGGIEEIPRLGQVIDLPTEFGGHRREGRGRRTISPMLNCADRLESSKGHFDSFLPLVGGQGTGGRNSLFPSFSV